MTPIPWAVELTGRAALAHDREGRTSLTVQQSALLHFMATLAASPYYAPLTDAELCDRAENLTCLYLLRAHDFEDRVLRIS